MKLSQTNPVSILIHSDNTVSLHTQNVGLMPKVNRGKLKVQLKIQFKSEGVSEILHYLVIFQLVEHLG